MEIYLELQRFLGQESLQATQRELDSTSSLQVVVGIVLSV
jgi:hypothetical protein